ncbi:VapE domain-containing protein [Bacteroides sp. 224]|uniref:VapE domain-containing protein n=1 Tax=Bacteroides sp. 224 TaxID=2302936 RepID=UPI0013D800BD|nr:VapE domain-containing protein [Bacteroides sp. 224]NDV64976.1 virulence protein E [Bacteroides sp. 224]
MKEINVTAYQGFSKVTGHITIEQLVLMIQSDKYAKSISKIQRLISSGKLEEANRVKRQLDFFTITTLYHHERQPHSIAAYNDLITIDIDGLSNEEVFRLRPLIEQDPTTIFCFLTVKQHGFKIIAHLKTPSAQTLRDLYLKGTELTYSKLEDYHEQMYRLTRLHYEQIPGITVDTSGKDLSRGIFASYDPLAFFSPERLEQACQNKIPPITQLPEPTVKKRIKQTTRSVTPATTDSIDPGIRLAYRKCVKAIEKEYTYTEGQYNTFLFALGNKCMKRKLSMEIVQQLAAEEFGEGGRWNTDEPIRNAYTYTDKTEKAEKDKTPPSQRALEYLDEHFLFRRNVILERLEMKEKEAENTTFRTMRLKDFNTIFLHICRAGIPLSQQNLKAIIDSEYTRDYNPITGYFAQLPPWDEKTDYIGQLATTIETDDSEFWNDALRRWITGMTACAMGLQEANQLVLLLHGGQGKGKSTWIRHLLPPTLKEYYRNGMIDPGNKDDMMMLATRLLINMEEFEGVKQSDIAELKRIIALENITLRKPYDIQAHSYPRKASFIGSTNNLQFLKDNTGSRRFLVVSVKKIDYKSPINHTGIFSQARFLAENDFQYWYEGNEVDTINARNEKHRIKDPLEENLYIFFRKATERSLDTKWKPAAAILAFLSIHGRTLANAQAQQILVHILERDGFRKRKNELGITEYGVIMLSPEEIDMNARKQQEKPIEKTGELPF